MKLSLFSTRALGSVQGALIKNAPTILTVAGVAGFAVTAALAGRAAIKAQGVVSSAKRDFELASKTEISQFYTKKMQSEEAGKALLRGGAQLAKIYGPAIVLGSTSAVCIFAAHGMMLKRQAALVAAYGVLDAGFKAYRKRVQEEFGEEKELKLYRGVRTVESVDEEGQPCEIIDMSDVVPSAYSRFFDETSKNWTRTPEWNLMFLRAQQDWANDRLRAYGYIFLNEVYEALGIPRSQAGQIVGWKLKEASDDDRRDGYVDFGLYDLADECNRAFVNGLEHTVLLDFNVDGPIHI